MWTEDDEIAYETLLKQLKETLARDVKTRAELGKGMFPDPARVYDRAAATWREQQARKRDAKTGAKSGMVQTPLLESETNLALLRKLMREAINAPDVPGKGNIYYNKLTKLYNLFIDDYLTSFPDDFSDTSEKWMNKETELLWATKERLDKVYPILHQVSAMISEEITRANQDAESQHERFMHGVPFTEDETRLLAVWTGDNHPFARPEGGFKAPSDFPFREMATQILQQHPTFDKEKELHEYIEAYYKRRRARSLQELHDLYNTFDLRHLRLIDSVCYYPLGGDDTMCFYGGSTIDDILPHPIFKKIMQLEFQSNPDALVPGREGGASYIAAQLFAKMTVERNPNLRGFTIRKKMGGKDPGFILVSPDGKKKLYGKYTGNVFSEYFCAMVMNELGIKMPESEIVVDALGKPLFLTLDASREYTKGGAQKKKSFRPISDLLKKAPIVAFGFGHRSYDGPIERPRAGEEKVVKEFLDHVMSSPKSRVSYAKLLLSGLAFGHSDLFEHGGNIGIIETEKSGGQYQKFGIVDYQFRPHDITNDDVLKQLESAMMSEEGVMPIFKMLYERLKDHPEDILEAAKELTTPKVRLPSETGYLLTQLPTQRTDARSVIEKVYKQFMEKVHALYPDDKDAGRRQKLIERVEQQKNLMIQNLEYIGQQLPRELSPRADHRL